MKPFTRPLKISIIFIAGLILISKNAVGQYSNHSIEPVKIGLLVPDSNSFAARNGAELAIKEANAKGGFDGRPYQLVVRYLEGPWGTGSKQAVNLIFDEKVWVLMGSHDGRNAHLVEQAATKSRVVFLSAWSGDPTLSQAFVPWFFNCVPNDNQQANVIAEAIFTSEGKMKPVVVSDEIYDSKSTLKSFLLKIKERGCSEPVQITWENAGNNPEKVAELIQKNNASTVVLLCQPRISAKIAEVLRQKNMNLKILSSISVLNEDELTLNDILCFDNMLNLPSEEWDEKELSLFRDKYFQSYGKLPGIVASYAFDGMNVLIQAVRAAGSNEREKIQKCLTNINYHGVTGLIHFDEKGNRTGNLNLRIIKNGVPVKGWKSRIDKTRP
jgi:branched-chain amino acid transport system substrate-binding protein